MDPFQAFLWLMFAVLLMVLMLPLIKMFNFTLRSMIKSTRKTLRTIRS